MAKANASGSTGGGVGGGEINDLDLETLKETFRLEIRKELKIKEGAEKILKVSDDRKSKAYVATILKNCNEKLDQLHSELSALQAQVPDDDGKFLNKDHPTQKCAINNSTITVGKCFVL